MSEKTKDSLRSTADLCQRITDTVLDLFVDRLLEEMKNNHEGWLDRHELAEMARQFRAKESNRYLRRTRQIAEDWRAAVEKDLFEQTRKHPFERVLVKRFSHLFPPHESLRHPGALSRRILPGLFVAFEQMAGAAFIEQCNAVGRGLLRGLKDERGADFSWKDFYADPAANDLVDDLMVVIAWGFRDFEKRLKWLLHVIEDNLAAPEDFAFEGDSVAEWVLERRSLLELLRALFSEIKDRLAEKDGRREVKQRYGLKAFKTLETVVHELDKAR